MANIFTNQSGILRKEAGLSLVLANFLPNPVAENYFFLWNHDWFNVKFKYHYAPMQGRRLSTASEKVERLKLREEDRKNKYNVTVGGFWSTLLTRFGRSKQPTAVTTLVRLGEGGLGMVIPALIRKFETASLHAKP